jgi:hypothetical protein
VLHLHKALFGLRQTPRAWNAKLYSTLKGMGFGQSPHEAAIYRWGIGGNILLVGVYIDDLVITGTKDVEVAAVMEGMKATFPISVLGCLSFYMGLRCTRATSGSHFDRSPMPSMSLSWLGSPTASQLSLRWRMWTLHSTDVMWGAFAPSPTHGRTWHSPSATLVSSCSDQ